MSVLLDSFRHNYWATKRLVEFCRSLDLTDEQLAVTGVGTFGGITATLEHIIVCDASYLRRVADDVPEWIEKLDGSQDLAQLEAWAAELGELWEHRLALPIDTEAIIVVDNCTRETRAGIFFAQALNHANHHREQVCAILTAFGFDPPDIQAWEYAWTSGRIWDRMTD